MTDENRKRIVGVLRTLVVVAAFFAGGYLEHRERVEEHAECVSVIDDFVLLTTRLEEQLHSIPNCDCPGPEECDIEATCNRDAMLCCMTLARQETEEP